MAIQDIKNLIASKIAGQGNQVDSGGKLADILNEICDAIAARIEPISVDWDISSASSGDSTDLDDWSQEQLDKLWHASAIQTKDGKIFVRQDGIVSISGFPWPSLTVVSSIYAVFLGRVEYVSGPDLNEFEIIVYGYDSGEQVPTLVYSKSSGY